MPSYNDNDITYNHALHPILYSVKLYIRLEPDDIEGIEEHFYTALSDYHSGEYNFENGRWQGGNYSIVVKTDGTEVGTNASFSHNHKTEEIKIHTDFQDEDEPHEEEGHYKAVISLPSLIEETYYALQEDGVFTRGRCRGLQVWVEFTERGWNTNIYSDYDSSPEEIEELRRQEQE